MSSRIIAAIDERIAQIHHVFEANGWTLALAESCTGGLISSLIAKRSGVSRFYLGSVVSYSAELKKSLLDVRETSILCHGEVSLPVAAEMARGAKSRMKSTWAVSVTGIAGPTGGSEEKPVGTVCFSVVGPGFESTQMQHFKSESREEIQLESARFAIEFLWDSIHA